MRFKNIGIELTDDKGRKTTQKVHAIAKGPHGLDINVPFGEEVDIPDVWCKPRRYQNGSRKPSPIEMMAPQLVPANDAEREEWSRIPPEEAPVKRGQKGGPAVMTVEALVAQGLPRGIAETLVATYQAGLAAAQAAVKQEA